MTRGEENRSVEVRPRDDPVLPLMPEGYPERDEAPDPRPELLADLSAPGRVRSRSGDVTGARAPAVEGKVPRTRFEPLCVLEPEERLARSNQSSPRVGLPAVAGLSVGDRGRVGFLVSGVSVNVGMPPAHGSLRRGGSTARPRVTPRVIPDPDEVPVVG